MKLTRQARRNSGIQLSLTSMIDVVFLLLIFFMCSTTFKGTEEVMPSPLPKSAIVPVASPQDDFEPIRIHLAMDGDTVQITINNAEISGFEQASAILDKLSDVSPEAPVIISSEPTVYFKYCVRAFDLCRQADFTRLRFMRL